MKTLSYLIVAMAFSFISFSDVNKKLSGTDHRYVACIKTLKRDAKKYWHYNFETKLYTANDTFLENLYKFNYICLKGMDTIQFYKIFGKENRGVIKDIDMNGTIEYNLYPGKSAYTLIVNFNQKGKITEILSQNRIYTPYSDNKGVKK